MIWIGIFAAIFLAYCRGFVDGKYFCRKNEIAQMQDKFERVISGGSIK